MSVPLVARKKLLYTGVTFIPGQSFEARDESDARLLVTIGLASYAPQPQPVIEAPDLPSEPEPVVAETDAVVSDDASETAVEPSTSDAVDDVTPSPGVETDDVNETVPTSRRRRGTYRRRDMVADD